MTLITMGKIKVLSWSCFLLIVLILVACGPAVDPGFTGESQNTQSNSESSDDSTAGQAGLSLAPVPGGAGDESESEAGSKELAGEPIVIDEEAVEIASNNLEVGFTEDGHPYMGDPSAPIVIKEFSDFQCPFCGRFYKETLPTIKDGLISEGKAVFVYYDFPLTSIHPQAMSAANAARCAGEQGAPAFWDMHDTLFDELEQWSRPEPLSVFSSFAAEIGLKVVEFEKCFSLERYRGKINADLDLGVANGVTGTPSFLINEQLLVGAQPTEDILAAVELVYNGGQLPGAITENSQPGSALAPTPAVISNEFAAELGDPSAPVRIVEFTDYQCPFCYRHFVETMPQIIAQLVDSGRVYYQLKDLPLEQIHSNARLAAAAARCAGDQGDYWSMHDLLFDNQSEWAPLAGSEITEAFTLYAKEIGLGQDSFTDCLASGVHEAAINSNLAEAGSLGISGTPFFLVDGYPLNGARPFEQFEYAVTLAEQGRLSEAYAPPEPEPTGPRDVPIGEAYSIGEENAPITIVEYTDYQCPFCGRHFAQTFPQIVERFVDTGVVRYVFKDFPIATIHPQAVKAAEAARCAGDQGQYLEMHDILFERQSGWGGGDPSDKFISYAGELGLDATLFEECLSSGRHEEAVKADLNEGIQLGVTGTPAFFINGNPISGAQPFSLFEEAVSTLLDS